MNQKIEMQAIMNINSRSQNSLNRVQHNKITKQSFQPLDQLPKLHYY